MKANITKKEIVITVILLLENTGITNIYNAQQYKYAKLYLIYYRPRIKQSDYYQSYFKTPDRNW